MAGKRPRGCPRGHAGSKLNLLGLSSVLRLRSDRTVADCAAFMMEQDTDRLLRSLCCGPSRHQAIILTERPQPEVSENPPSAVTATLPQMSDSGAFEKWRLRQSVSALPQHSDLDLFCNRHGIIHIYAEIADRPCLAPGARGQRLFRSCGHLPRSKQKSRQATAREIVA